MTQAVVDASALLEACLDQTNGPIARRVFGLTLVHAPHLIDLEILSALRRNVRTGVISDYVAGSVRTQIGRLRLSRYSHLPLSARIWSLRDNLTPYDAAYIALAERLRMPLLTCDQGFAAVPDIGTHVEYHAPA